MTTLNYLSTLEEVTSCPDNVLGHEIGQLSPDVVTRYIFFLRSELQSARQHIEAKDQEINFLKFKLKDMSKSH